jgi:predicted neutral ceramidase superfamily lipid hydrolase
MHNRIMTMFPAGDYYISAMVTNDDDDLVLYVLFEINNV